MKSRAMWFVILGFATSASAIFSPCPLRAQWVQLQDETTSRLIASPTLGEDDVEEKDYIWGDLDNDGDIDLICVRKEPFTTTGRRVNVLFMNEGIADGQLVDGVLVDRTTEYATASDVPGDLGFQTPTNDRDVALADFDNDGWLDFVTAVTLSDNQPKSIKMPRVYFNLGENPQGEWLGFEYRDAWIPDLSAEPGIPTESGPRFCSVVATDLTGDGLPDLYFGDYDAQGAGQFVPMIHDYNDVCLINTGTGFVNQTTVVFQNMLQPTGSPPQPFYQSTFSASVAAADMNDDGVIDIIKQSSLQDPRFVAISYGNPTLPGTYDQHDEIYSQAAYFVSAGDLNNDGLNDLVVVDDFQDRYLLNQGATNGVASFTSGLLLGSAPEFGGNSVIADLDRDGFNDVLVADVDVDVIGCSRRMHAFRNQGNVPFVTLMEEGPIQPWMTQGVHDVAVFDLNGDGWLDLVVGRCTGTEVWINDPPVEIEYVYPGGRPTEFAPDLPVELTVEVVPSVGAIDPSSVRAFWSTNGGPTNETQLTSLGGDLYQLSLPALPCGSRHDYYLSASFPASNDAFLDPPDGEFSPHGLVAGDFTLLLSEERFEVPADNWTVQSTSGLTSGAWEQADPNGTVNFGALVAPEDDAGSAPDVQCFVTGNGPPGGSAIDWDVDNGITRLFSPLLDLEGTDARIDFDFWMVSVLNGNDSDDLLNVSVSPTGGGGWVTVASFPNQGSGWNSFRFTVSDFIEPTSQVQVRFTVGDGANNSLTEAGIDNFVVTLLDCASFSVFIRGDVNADGGLDIADPIGVLGYLFNETGLLCVKSADANDDGQIDIGDSIALLGALFNNTGPLPGPTSCDTDPTPDVLSCVSYPGCP